MLIFRGEQINYHVSRRAGKHTIHGAFGLLFLQWIRRDLEAYWTDYQHLVISKSCALIMASGYYCIHFVFTIHVMKGKKQGVSKSCHYTMTIYIAWPLLETKSSGVWLQKKKKLLLGFPAEKIFGRRWFRQATTFRHQKKRWQWSFCPPEVFASRWLEKMACSIWVLKPMVVGYHHLRKPPYTCYTCNHAFVHAVFRHIIFLMTCNLPKRTMLLDLITTYICLACNPPQTHKKNSKEIGVIFVSIQRSKFKPLKSC